MMNTFPHGLETCDVPSHPNDMIQNPAAILHLGLSAIRTDSPKYNMKHVSHFPGMCLSSILYLFLFHLTFKVHLKSHLPTVTTLTMPVRWTPFPEQDEPHLYYAGSYCLTLGFEHNAVPLKKAQVFQGQKLILVSWG